MSFGFREERRRRRRQVNWTVLKWALAFGLIGAAGLYAYQSGSRLAEMEVNRLQGEIASLSQTVTELELQNAEQRAAIGAEQQRAEEWRNRYDHDVPTGDDKQLFDLVQKKLADGVAIDRLRFVIGAAQNKQDCDADALTKRFIVQTPLHTGADSAVSFADGMITVTALGTPARDTLGNPEAWFDPAEPITVRLTHVNGKTAETSGKLPLYPSLVVGDSEFRFNLVAGPRGFAQVAGTRCRYP